MKSSLDLEWKSSATTLLYSVKMKPERKITVVASNLLAALVLSQLVSMLPARADLGDAQLTEKIRSQKALPAGCQVKASRVGELVTVDLSAYPSNDATTRKADALLISRAIVHADPGSTTGIIVRVHSSSNPSDFTEIVVSNREIVGADAGLYGARELMEGLGMVHILGTDGPSQLSAKYLTAAESELSKEDLREADYFFREALRQGGDQARQDPRLLTGLVNLAEKFHDREDSEAEIKAHALLRDVSASELSTGTLPGLREAYDYFDSRDDASGALSIAQKLVSIQRQSGSDGSIDFSHDLEKLGRAELDSGQAGAAKKSLEEALLIQRNKLGENSPVVASVMELLGDCYSSEGNKSQAFEFYKQAKINYDYAMTSKDQKQRLAFEVYQGIVQRLDKKMSSNSKP